MLCKDSARASFAGREKPILSGREILLAPLSVFPAGDEPPDLKTGHRNAQSIQPYAYHVIVLFPEDDEYRTLL
jgi:hypothetical protein